MMKGSSSPFRDGVYTLRTTTNNEQKSAWAYKLLAALFLAVGVMGGYMLLPTAQDYQSPLLITYDAPIGTITGTGFLTINDNLPIPVTLETTRGSLNLPSPVLQYTLDMSFTGADIFKDMRIERGAKDGGYTLTLSGLLAFEPIVLKRHGGKAPALPLRADWSGRITITADPVVEPENVHSFCLETEKHGTLCHRFLTGARA